MDLFVWGTNDKIKSALCFLHHQLSICQNVAAHHEATQTLKHEHELPAVSMSSEMVVSIADGGGRNNHVVNRVEIGPLAHSTTVIFTFVSGCHDQRQDQSPAEEVHGQCRACHKCVVSLGHLDTCQTQLLPLHQRYVEQVTL